MRQHVERIIAVAIGLMSFVAVVPLRCLDPHDVTWALRGDAATQVLGWLYFCDAPWRLPLGATARYVAPIGSTLMMTDSLPPVAVVARVLGACRVGQTQYLGLWLLLCFVMQAVTARGLAARLGMPIEQRLAVCVVCAFAPIFTWRTGHVTLCGQFLVLLAIQFAVTANTDATRGSLARVLSLVFFSALLHPYLMVMVVGFSVVACFRRPDQRAVAVVGAVGAVVVVTVFALWLVGALAVEGQIAGFGRYQSDVLEAFDSGGAGRLMRPLSVTNTSHEGLAYLGFGLLVGLAVSLFSRRSRSSAVALFPASIWIMAGAFWLYSLSTTVLVAGHVVLRAQVLAEVLSPIASVFRASGRFVWPLWYLVAFAVVAAVGRLRQPRVLLAALVMLQLVDAAGTVAVWVNSRSQTLKDARWPALAADRTTLVLVPSLLMNTPMHGGAAWPDIEVYVPFARLALEHGLSTNSGYLARPPVDALQTAETDVDTALQTGTPDPATLYAFPAKDTRALTMPALCCLHLDDAIACVARSTAGALPCADVEDSK